MTGSEQLRRRLIALVRSYGVAAILLWGVLPGLASAQDTPAGIRAMLDSLERPAPFGLGLRHARGIRLISPGACPWRDDNKRPTWAKSATRTLMLSDQSWGAGQVSTADLRARESW